MTGVIKKIGDLNADPIQQITLKNASLNVAILTYGATIQSIHLAGYEHSLVLGAQHLSAYQDQATYFGAVVGRVANRIAKGHAVIDGQAYQLPLSPPEPNQLHGGPLGTGRRNWQIVSAKDDELHLQIKLLDGEMGYPGNMLVDLFYRLIDSSLEMEISATADQTTLCNFAGHSYFNLDGTGSVLDHKLMIQADAYLPVDDVLIPTGKVKAVENTPFDFRTLRPIGAADYPELDTNFCLTNERREICEVATLVAPLTGLTLNYQTTEPGLQVYDGRHISMPSKLNVNQGELHAHSGLALEAQCWPDANHHQHFPSILLTPEQVYRQKTRYSFA